MLKYWDLTGLPRIYDQIYKVRFVKFSHDDDSLYLENIEKKTTRVFHVGGPEPGWKLSPNIPLDLSDDANNKLYNWIVLKF